MEESLAVMKTYLQPVPAIQWFADFKKQTPRVHKPGFHTGLELCDVAKSTLVYYFIESTFVCCY